MIAYGFYISKVIKKDNYLDENEEGKRECFKSECFAILFGLIECITF